MLRGKGIIYFGRQHPIKDIPTLQAACGKLGLTFDIVSDIPMNDIGAKIEALSSHAIFVLPSKREAFPGALLEAMALGRVCIASRTQGAEELIEHGKNGFLFNVGDSEELAKLIDYCMKNNVDNMRIKARNSVREMTWSRIVDRLEAACVA